MDIASMFVNLLGASAPMAVGVMWYRSRILRRIEALEKTAVEGVKVLTAGEPSGPEIHKLSWSSSTELKAQLNRMPHAQLLLLESESARVSFNRRLG